ncbi:hypothetical protein WA026_005184 [Henosepilachna vigintioctopunctata]|uniref:Uncharacterized protein n=1 Tax=Henosepilachna vigintioctopunctata TaxID=420089 RepID=A0AAW1UXD7_9CUCU
MGIQTWFLPCGDSGGITEMRRTNTLSPPIVIIRRVFSGYSDQQRVLHKVRKCIFPFVTKNQVVYWKDEQLVRKEYSFLLGSTDKNSDSNSSCNHGRYRKTTEY